MRRPVQKQNQALHRDERGGKMNCASGLRVCRHSRRATLSFTAVRTSCDHAAVRFASGERANRSCGSSARMGRRESHVSACSRVKRRARSVDNVGTS